MENPRSHAAAAVHSGKLIVCGGWNGIDHLRNVECFDPESGIWTKMNDMPTPRWHHSLVSYGNKLILMGGHDDRRMANTVLELSNLEEKGTWTELPPMKSSRSNFCARSLANEIVVIGGWNQAEVEIFDGESWRDGPPLPHEYWDMSCVVIPQPLADILCNYKE